MKVSIRASKHQNVDLTSYQMMFGANCISRYMDNELTTCEIYSGTHIVNASLECEVYRTKTQISAVVYFK